MVEGSRLEICHIKFWCRGFESLSLRSCGLSMKEDRIEIIKEIIKSQKIDSQETLLGVLKEQGIDVTQATLSRDLKSIGATRISDGWSGYYYALPKEDETLSINDYIRDVHLGVKTIEFSGSFGVIKTRVGHANSVCAALDKIKIPEILGTVAGDDTIFVVLREGCTKEDLLESFKEKIPEYK